MYLTKQNSKPTTKHNTHQQRTLQQPSHSRDLPASEVAPVGLLAQYTAATQRDEDAYTESHQRSVEMQSKAKSDAATAR